MKHLAPKAVWLFFMRGIIGFLAFYIILGFYGGFYVFAFFASEDTSSNAIIYVILFNLFILALVIFFSFIWARLAYNNYKYELRDDGFRKESGVVWKKYVTIPYERIQNVDIYRGIMARILGLSDLHIQTAGNSVSMGRFGGMGAEGRLPGLSTQDAELIRDELIKRAKGQQVNQAHSNPQPNQGL